MGNSPVFRKSPARIIADQAFTDDQLEKKAIIMLNSIKVLGVIAVSSALLLSNAYAAGTKIVNQSGLPIDELVVASPGSGQWGKNLMEGAKEGSLDSGKSYVVGNLKDGVYDFQLSAPDEAVFCTMKNVSVKGGVAKLTKKMAKACS